MEEGGLCLLFCMGLFKKIGNWLKKVVETIVDAVEYVIEDSKENVVLYTTTYKLYDDEVTAELNQALLAAMLAKGDMPKTIITAKQKLDATATMNRIMNKALASDEIGVPVTTRAVPTMDDKTYQAIIASKVEGALVNIEESAIIKNCFEQAVFAYLSQNRNMSFTDLVITHSFTPPAEDTDNVLTYDRYEAVNETTATIYYTGVHDDEVTIYEVSEQVVLPNYSENTAIHWVRYHLQSDPTIIKYWIYRVSDGTYYQLGLDQLVKDYAYGDYFPIIPIRQSGVDLNKAYADGSASQANKTLYQESKNILNILNMDIEALSESIKKLDTNEDDTTNGAENVHICLGISVNAERDDEIRYLHDFFKYQNTYDTFTKAQFDAANDVVKLYYHNKLNLTTSAVKLNFSWKYTDVNTVAGSIGDGTVGNAESVYTDPGNERDYVIFRYQEAPNLISEVTVCALKLESKYTSDKEYIVDDSFTTTKLKDVFSGDNPSGIWIPLNLEVMEDSNYDSLTERNIFANALQMHIQVVSVTELGFWENELVRGAITVVLIVGAAWLTIVSLGSLGGGAGAVVAAWLGLSGVAAVAVAVLVNIAIMYGIKLLGQWVMDQLDLTPEQMLWVQAILTIATFVTGQLDMDVLSGTLMFLSTAWTAGVEAEMAEAMEEIEEELAEATENYETGSSVLDEMYEEMEVDKTTQEYLMKALRVRHTGDMLPPTAYYNLKIHTGNIGTLALEQPRQYVDQMLTLPRNLKDLEI